MFRKGNLVQYKDRCAVVEAVGDKIEIQSESGESLRVREKDIRLVHEGPVSSISRLKEASEAMPQGDFETARELLEGKTASLAELCELAYGGFSPEAALACLHATRAGASFTISDEGFTPRSEEAIREIESQKAEKEAQREKLSSFSARAKRGEPPLPDDARFVQELEAAANGKAQGCRVLRELHEAETEENAQALLLRMGVWSRMNNPSPMRAGASTRSPDEGIEGLTRDDAGRRDLRDMEAFAIDSEWSHDPDDAVSFREGRLWVHVADPTSLFSPGSKIDIEARSRGATLYLPEGNSRMLSEALLAEFGLGLAPESPAISFGILLDSEGEIENCEICASSVRVQRLTYDAAEAMLEKSPLKELMAIARRNEARRMAAGATSIEIPECHVSIVDAKIEMRAIPRHQSSILVREAMLIAGEAAARYAREKKLPFPFVTQEPPTNAEEAPEFDEAAPPKPFRLSKEFAKRKTMRPRFVSVSPSQHAGLGLALYAQVTSPLRRYTDLLAHYQLRASLNGSTPISTEDMEMAIAQAEAANARVRMAERSSDEHWILAFLEQEGEREYEAVVVDSQGSRYLVYIPEIGYETRVMGLKGYKPDERVKLQLKRVDLAARTSVFEAL